jgi:hypothetical protein
VLVKILYGGDTPVRRQPLPQVPYGIQRPGGLDRPGKPYGLDPFVGCGFCISASTALNACSARATACAAARPLPSAA